MVSPVFQYLEQKQRTKIVPIAVVAILLISGVGYVAYTLFLKPQELPLNQQETQNSPPASEEKFQQDQPLSDKIDTSDWKTYRNEEFGFEFKYPSEYKVVGNGGVFGFIIVHEDKDSQIESPYITMYLPATHDAAANPKAEDLRDYMDGYRTTSEQGYIEYIANGEAKFTHEEVIIHEQTELLMGGLRALKQTYSYGSWRDSAFYTQNEYNEDHAIRYVFFNEKSDTFVILKTHTMFYPKNDIQEYEARLETFSQFLDSVAHSFQFDK